MTIDENYINNHLIDNRALFNYIYIIEQTFDIISKDNKHYGASIDYQDIKELRSEFLEQLYDSIVNWVYSTKKYKKLKNIAIKSGKTDEASANEVFRRAVNTFRANRNSDKLLIQGQLGELLLFHFIQKLQKAIPLLRKMKITTSSAHERYGADAIHFKYEKNNPIIILGEAKVYTSEYSFNKAFEDAIISILKTYEHHRDEINFYTHEDFLEDEMNTIAEQYINNQLENVEVNLVSIIVYNETLKLNGDNRDSIRKNIADIIAKRYSKIAKRYPKVDIENNTILKRITYIVFPVWDLDMLANDFQKML